MANMKEAIASWVDSCRVCQESRPAPPTARGNIWKTPKAPWLRLHIDLSGLFHGKTFLVVVDAYSKSLEVALMSTTTLDTVIRVLRGLFATHGLPNILVSDNRAQFTSGKFERYLLGLGIRHALTVPFHLASNRKAKQIVRSAKEAMARMDQGDWNDQVAEYLLIQLITPHTATGRSPAELLMGHRLRTPLDWLHLDFAVIEPVGSAGAPQSFVPRDRVFTRNFAGDVLWLPAVVLGISGPRSYQVVLEDSHLWLHHINQLRRQVEDLDTAEVPSTTPEAAPQPPATQETKMPGNTDSRQSASQEVTTEPSRVPTVSVPASPGRLTSAGSSMAPVNSGNEVGAATQTGSMDLAGPASPDTGPHQSARVSRRPAYLKDYCT